MARPRLVDIFAPTPAQWRVHERLRRFNIWVCHRGFGKTYLGVHELFRVAAERDGYEAVRLAYITDLRVNAKDKAWNPVVESILHALPELNGDRGDLAVRFPGGSEITFYGTREDHDRVRGKHLDGVVFDEYALVPPTIWELVVLPALLRRNGGAIFMGTPMGRNHFHGLYQAHRDDPEWDVQVIRAGSSGVYTAAQLDLVRANLTPEQYAQEYECSWDTPMQGAVYARELLAARDSGRIRVVAHDPVLETETWWDLGAADATAIWFTQTVDREIRLIDYAEDARKDLAWYAKLLREKPYVYARHHLPHDAGAERLEGGLRSIERQLNELGIRPTTVHPRQDVTEGVAQARLRFARCWFDEKRTARGLEALEAYHYEWDVKRQVAKNEPDHDWSSHGADAFRLMATHHRGAPPRHIQTKALRPRDLFDYWRDRPQNVYGGRTVW